MVTCDCTGQVLHGTCDNLQSHRGHMSVLSHPPVSPAQDHELSQALVSVCTQPGLQRVLCWSGHVGEAQHACFLRLNK